MKHALTRKLAVILHADVVGSTALVHRDETLAHQRIRDVFCRFSKTIGLHGGIAHELRGDALVAEFDRASDAVAASLAFQTENTRFNSTLDDNIRYLASAYGHLGREEEAKSAFQTLNKIFLNLRGDQRP